MPEQNTPISKIVKLMRYVYYVLAAQYGYVCKNMNKFIIIKIILKKKLHPSGAAYRSGIEPIETYQNLKSLSPLSILSRYPAALARVCSLGTVSSKRLIIVSPLARVAGDA